MLFKPSYLSYMFMCFVICNASIASGNAGSINFLPEQSVLNGGYPRLTQAKTVNNNGVLELLLGASVDEANSTVIYVKKSTDYGETWGNQIEVAREPSSTGYTVSNTFLVTLANGDILCTYRRINETTKHYQLPVKISKDGGSTWSHLSIIHSDSGLHTGLWEPFIIELPNHELLASYADTRVENVRVKRSTNKGLSWGTATDLAGSARQDRDGMPGMVYTQDRQLIAVFETVDNPGTPQEYFYIDIVRSNDYGQTWFDRRTVYKDPAGYAGAPYIIQLDHGDLVVSFQMRHQGRFDSDNPAHFAYVVSSDNGNTWGNIQEPFGSSDSSESLWNAIYQIKNGVVFALTSGVKLKRGHVDQDWQSIKVKQGDFALSVAHTTNGTPVNRKAYQNTSFHHWALRDAGNDYFWIESRAARGKALEVWGYSEQSGAPIMLYDFVGGDNQLWGVEDQGAGYYQLINKFSGKSLDVPISSSPIVAITQYGYWGGDNQIFKSTSIANGSTAAFGNYTPDWVAISPRHDPAQCLDIPNTNNGQTIYQWGCHSGLNQDWKFNETQDGYVWIESRFARGKAIEVGGFAQHNGGDIVLWRYLGGVNQKWQKADIGSGYYTFTSQDSGLNLDIDLNTQGNSANLQQWQYLGWHNQQFRLIPH